MNACLIKFESQSSVIANNRIIIAFKQVFTIIVYTDTFLLPINFITATDNVAIPSYLGMASIY